MDEDTTEAEKLDAMRTALNSTILAQQTAIEILTNILCGGDDSDEEGWDDFDSDGGMVSYLFYFLCYVMPLDLDFFSE